MKENKWKFAVTFTAFFILVYHMSPIIGLADDIIIAMFVTAPLLTFWMAYRVLKYGVESTKRFDDGYFYDDLEKIE